MMYFKKLFFILFTLGVFSLSAQKATISGSIQDTNYKKLVIHKINMGKLEPVDSTLISKGKFSIEILVSEPEIRIVKFEPSEQMYTQWVIHPQEKISLEYKIENTPILTKTKGSKDMAYIQKFIQTEQSSSSTLNELRSKYENAPEGEKNDIAKKFQEEASLVENQLKGLISENKNLLATLFTLDYFSQNFEQNIDLFKEVYNATSVIYPEHYLVKGLKERLSSALLLGSDAPDIALPDLNGEIRKLSSLRGKIVLIDFWASWCKPCRIENPHVVKLYDTYKDKGFAIYSVSLDQKKEGWENAIKADHLAWEDHVSDLKGWNSEGGKLYGVRTIPFTVLIDREGKIIAINLRGDALKSKLSELFD